jgi:hypothetical protein
LRTVGPRQCHRPCRAVRMSRSLPGCRRRHLVWVRRRPFRPQKAVSAAAPSRRLPSMRARSRASAASSKP